MPLLVDTNHVSYLLKGNLDVVQGFRDHRHETPHVSVVTVGELLSGARHVKSAHLERLIQQFLDECPSVPVDDTIADEYADIRVHLWSQGRPIPDNDIWIAATARELGYRLIARDKHFRNIPGLAVESWFPD